MIRTVPSPGLSPTASSDGSVALVMHSPGATATFSPGIIPSSGLPARPRAGMAKPLGGGWKWQGPKDPAAFLCFSLRSRLEAYRKQLRQCHKKFTEESVHQLRVATRRLMTQFILLRCVTAGNNAEKARQKLKQRLKTLGALRDTHVQRLFIEAQLKRFP